MDDSETQTFYYLFIYQPKVVGNYIKPTETIYQRDGVLQFSVTARSGFSFRFQIMEKTIIRSGLNLAAN